MKISIAPMEGVVDNIVRDLLTQIGGYDHCVTEFIRVTKHLLPPKVFYQSCPELLHGGRTPSGVPVYIQLLGGDPQILADNAAVAEGLGATGIDLNFGCPAKTVNRHDGGAVLLKNPHRLFDIITSVKKAVSLPVTAKVRLGFENKNLSQEIATAVDEAGANQLTIHARTKVEGYRPPAHWEFIALMKESVQIPIVANGDIWTLQDYINCRKITKCEDVALGRTAMTNPFLAKQIKHFLTHGEDFKETTSPFEELRNRWLPLFLKKSCQQKGDLYALNRLKQWLRFLKRNHKAADDLFEIIKTQKNLQEVSQHINLDENWRQKVAT